MTGSTPRKSNVGSRTNAPLSTRPAATQTHGRYISLHRPCQNNSTAQNQYPVINAAIASVKDSQEKMGRKTGKSGGGCIEFLSQT
jgi:hypothetical protein